MSNVVYIRPLELKDALISYQWRNNPKIWRFTGSKPDRYITPEIETEWLANTLQKNNDKRFAICLVENNLYIGNVFLTDITKNEAEIHIFIGDTRYWGNRRAYEALLLLAGYGFYELKLERIYAKINKKNLASSALAKSIGLVFLEEFYDERKDKYFLKGVFTKKMYEEHPYVLNSLNQNTYSG